MSRVGKAIGMVGSAFNAAMYGIGRVAGGINDVSGVIGSQINKLRDEAESTVAQGDIIKHDPLPNGMMSYSGPLGEFEYDPNEFKLFTVEHEGEATSFTILRYIGSETDGRKINIPEGITNCSMMFASFGDYGSGLPEPTIRVAPALPKSAKSAFAMFSGCDSLEDSSLVFSKNNKLRDARFMFSDCDSMVYGPSRMPSNTDFADYAFMNCGALKQAPSMNNRLRSADGMFVDCFSLDSTPDLPLSVESDVDFNFGCNDYDPPLPPAISDGSIMDYNEAKSKAESMLRPSVFARAGQAFSFVVQSLAERRDMDCGLFRAMKNVHELRKNNVLDKSFAAGINALVSNQPGDISSFIFDKTSKIMLDQRNKHEQAVRDMTVNIQGADYYGMSGKHDLNAVKKARHDIDSGVFKEIGNATAYEMQRLENRYSGSVSARERLFEMLVGNEEKGKTNIISRKQAEIARSGMADYYIREISAACAYYNTAHDCINKDGVAYDKGQHSEYGLHDDEIRGLEKMTEWSTSHLFESMSEMQEKHKVFTPEQLRQLDSLIEQLPVSAHPSFKFADRFGKDAGAEYESSRDNAKIEATVRDAMTSNFNRETKKAEDISTGAKVYRSAAQGVSAVREGIASGAGKLAGAVKSTFNRLLPDISGIEDESHAESEDEMQNH